MFFGECVNIVARSFSQLHRTKTVDVSRNPRRSGSSQHHRWPSGFHFLPAAPYQRMLLCLLSSQTCCSLSRTLYGGNELRSERGKGNQFWDRIFNLKLHIFFSYFRAVSWLNSFDCDSLHHCAELTRDYSQIKLIFLPCSICKLILQDIYCVWGHLYRCYVIWTFLIMFSSKTGWLLYKHKCNKIHVMYILRYLHIHTYNWYWCYGIDEYFMSTSRVFSSGIGIAAGIDGVGFGASAITSI